jgi:hypothetical protein
MINKHLCTGLLVSLVCVSSVIADTQLTSNYYSSKTSTPQTATILMKAGKLALQDANGLINGFYDSGRDVVFAVDHGTKSYYEIDRALATQVGGQLNSVMTTLNQQMEKAMAGMSEAQKQQFKAMMPAAMTRKPTPKPAQVSIRKTGKTSNIAGVSCDQAELLTDKQPAQQLCIASLQAAGISSAEMQSIKKLGQFAGQLAQLLDVGGMQQGQVNSASIAAAFEQIQGIPLAMNSNDGNSGRITAIKHDTIDTSVFTIPKGYQKKDVMSLMTGMGGK